ncbi:VCBS repeat-containing protein [candidate division KSB1 bacterium]|nr:VCBS repeat-containing protein [candidate division KSB1 bacterium]
MQRLFNFISIFICFVVVLKSNRLLSQDLPTFSFVESQSVGLTSTPYEKYGVAVADFDRNGYPDLCCTRWQGPGFSRIYMNQGGTFSDITAQTPMEQIESAEEGQRTYTPLWVDFDNDGDKDLCFSTISTFHLLRNDDNIFTEISQEVGFVSYKPGGFIMEWDVHPGSWADYDLDGDLDFAATQLSNPSIYLLRNDDGHFTDVAAEAGLGDTPMTQSWSLTFEDVDLDGDADLFSKNTFYFNENGFFTDASQTVGISDEIVTNYREMFDYDNDGDLDYVKVHSDVTEEPTIQLWENRDGAFVDVSEDAGLGFYYDPTRAISIGDFDNDGDQDVLVQSNILGNYDMLLLNEEVEPGVRVFADVSNYVGLTITGDRKGHAFIDYNMDGFLDSYTSSAELSHILYHNDGNGNNWIGLILEGTTSNRDAIGCLVTLHMGDQIQIRTKKCGNHVANQENPYIHFGLGQATEIDSLVIRWPLGIKQVFTNLTINEYHNINESDVTSVHPANRSATPASVTLDQNYPNPFNPATNIRFSLNEAGSVKVSIYNLNGQEVAALVDQCLKSGVHTLTWDASNMPSGIYVYRLHANGVVLSKKLMLLK